MCNRYSKSYILLINRYLICLFINAVAMLSRMFLCIFVFYHGKHMLYIFRSACKQAFYVLPTLVHCNNNVFTGLSQQGHEWRTPPHALFTLAERNLGEVAFSPHSPSALHFPLSALDFRWPSRKIAQVSGKRHHSQPVSQPVDARYSAITSCISEPPTMTLISRDRHFKARFGSEATRRLLNMAAVRS